MVLSGYQNPQLEGEADKLLLAGTAVPAEDYLQVQQTEGETVTLPVGYIQGATTGSRYDLYRSDGSVRKPDDKIAEADIVQVQTTTSSAQLTEKYRGKLAAGELIRAKAVEVSHRYREHRLRVYFDDVEPPAEPTETDVWTTGGSDKPDNQHYDVRVRGKDERGVPLVSKSGKQLLLLSRPGFDLGSIRKYGGGASIPTYWRVEVRIPRQAPHSKGR